MRRITTVLLLLTAAGLSAQTAPSSPASDEPTPALITSTQVLPGDSPMVAAAKRAMAARQKAKDRVHVSLTPGKGHIFQATGPVNVSFKMPPPDPKPRPARQAKSGIDVEALERKLQALLLEQEKIGSDLDEPYNGDGSEEDFADKKADVLRRQIEDLRRQIAQAQRTNPR
jgi:hypothetical protein